MSDGKFIARAIAYFYGFITGAMVTMGIGLVALWQRQHHSG